MKCSTYHDLETEDCLVINTYSTGYLIFNELSTLLSGFWNSLLNTSYEMYILEPSCFHPLQI